MSANVAHLCLFSKLPLVIKILLGLIHVFDFYNQCSYYSCQFYHNRGQKSFLNVRLVVEGSCDLLIFSNHLISNLDSQYEIILSNTYRFGPYY